PDCTDDLFEQLRITADELPDQLADPTRQAEEKNIACAERAIGSQRPGFGVGEFAMYLQCVLVCGVTHDSRHGQLMACNVAFDHDGDIYFIEYHDLAALTVGMHGFVGLYGL